MKKILAVVIVIAIILLLWFLFFKPSGKKTTTEPANKETTAKKHSPEFDKEISSLINSYIAMKNAFVSSDTAMIKQKTDSFHRCC